jgi:hypothetical protein
MDFTFGIITAGNADETLRAAIDSIRDQQIPNYEIIIVGKTAHTGSDIINIPFDESQKFAWITRKKNIICQRAKYENIVLMHDYIKLDAEWYEGFKKFGNQFDICVTKIKTIEGWRFRDYTIYGFEIEAPFSERALIPYDYTNTQLNKLMYISGSYYIIKKYVALKYPLNEKLSWNQGEDLDLSIRLRSANILMHCNKYSTVHLQKHKYQVLWEKEITLDDINYLEALSENDINIISDNQATKIKGLISYYSSL